MKLIGSLLYTNRGRIAVGFWGYIGPYAVDDFGNAIQTTNAQLNLFARQSH